jgi:thiol:disulfide interchange protein
MSEQPPNNHASTGRPPRASRIRQIGLIVALLLIVGWIGFHLLSAAASHGPTDPGLVDWRGDYTAALAEARQRDQRVLLKFTADWCPPCRWMDRNVFSKPSVAKAIESRYMPVKVDATEEAEPEMRMMQRWAVRGIPTMIILNAEGEEIARAPGRVETEALLKWLKQS